MESSKQVWFGMRLTPWQKQKIKQLARREGTSAKDALMRLVDEALTDDPIHIPEGSFLDGIEDLVGSVEGPPDLSTHTKYMEEFGR